MLVTARERGASATWQQWEYCPDGTPILALGVWTEKKPDRGEDAEPLVAHHRPSGTGLLSVFDGAGGAGAGLAGRSVRGRDRTNAWVAARAARAATEEWFAETSGWWPGEAVEESLRVHLAGRLADMRADRRRKIVGTMRRVLPTTVAAVLYRMDGPTVRWLAMWAGDSRCYLLQPTEGLQQLSQDDTDGHDALELLNEDPPMTNMVSADRPFRLTRAGGEASEPAILIAATDGFFGYVRTPAEFEYVLLSSLAEAADTTAWAADLAGRVHAYSGDDASLALIAVGFSDVDDLQSRLAERTHRLKEEHWEPMQRASEDGEEALRAARAESWSRYRGSYERLMPAVGNRTVR